MARQASDKATANKRCVAKFLSATVSRNDLGFIYSYHAYKQVRAGVSTPLLQMPSQAWGKPLYCQRMKDAVSEILGSWDAKHGG